MSKQTYINGFCKTASAAGVDPQALARYAMSYGAEKQAQESKPRFQTNGWAPRGVSTGNIPSINHSGLGYPSKGNSVDDFTGDELRSLEEQLANFRDPKYVRDDPEVGLYDLAYPEHKAWLGAHTNAVQTVLDKYLAKAKKVRGNNGYSAAVNPPTWLRDAVLRDYNKAMFDATNTPVRVESPRK